MCAYFTSDPFLKETLMENLKSPSKTRKHSKLGNAQTTNGQKWQMTISVWFSIQTYRSVQTTFWAPLSCHMLESLNRKMGKLKKPHPKILTRKLCEFVWEIREIVSKLERKTRTLSDLIGSILVNFRPFLKPLQIDSFNMSYSRAAKTLIKISLQTIYLMKTFLETHPYQHSCINQSLKKTVTSSWVTLKSILEKKYSIMCRKIWICITRRACANLWT